MKSFKTHLTFKNLSALTAYNFRIYSVNDIGESLGFSEITVEKQERMPERPKNFQALSYGDGRYELHWDKIPSVKRYVVSWCPAARNDLSRCSGQLNSSIVSNGIPAKTLPNLNASEYSFAVSSVIGAYRGDRASDMTWASCIVPMAAPGKPGKLPFSLSAIGTDSLRLQWKLNCPGLHVVISRFQIIYCRLSSKNGSCIDKKEMVVNNSRAESYTLKGLHQDAYYRVSMLMWSDNTAGEESDLIEARTGIETDFTFPIILGVLVIIITVLVIAACRKLFIKAKKEFKDLKQPVQLPGNLGDSYNLTKSINGQSNGRNGHLTKVDELRKNSGGSVGSHASSTGLLTPKQKMLPRTGNSFSYDSTEMKVLKHRDTTDSAVRDGSADGNSNTSHGSGLGTQSNDLFQASSKAYVTHERLNEMGRFSSTNHSSILGDGSHSVICQLSDGSSRFTQSSVPARVTPGYVQLQPEIRRIDFKPVVGCQNDPVV